MASATPKWPSLLDPSFRAVYGDVLENTETTYDKVFNVLNSKRAYEKETAASGLSRLEEKGQGDVISFEDPIPGYDVNYTHKTFGKGSAVTYEMWQDDQYGVMQRRPKDLANAKIRTLEQSGADIFNFGFTAGGGGTATFTSGDGLALFSTAHTATGDGVAVQSNTTTADLDEDSLEAAMVTMRATQDNKGQLQMVRPDTLLVPPALEKEARILLNSQGRVGTANNDINPYQGKLNIVVWDYLGAAAGGTDTAWFLIDSSAALLQFFMRDDRGVEGPEYDFKAKTAMWSVICRYSLGFSDWRGIYGSKGDNS